MGRWRLAGQGHRGTPTTVPVAPSKGPDRSRRGRRPVRGPGAAIVAVLAGVLATTGCATGGMTTGPTTPLPPIPSVTGDLHLYVGYPRDSAAIAVRDTTFIFGSTGRGDARLWINGRHVPVEPNGAFLAFLPVPQDGVYRLEARAGGATDTLTRVVVLPEPVPEPVDSARILPGTAYPAGPWVALEGERIEVGFRGTSGGEAALVFPDGRRVPLLETVAEVEGARRDFDVDPGQERDRSLRGWSDYRGMFTARRLFTLDTTVMWPGLTGELPPAALLALLPPDTAAEEAPAPPDSLSPHDVVPARPPADTMIGLRPDSAMAAPAPPDDSAAVLELVAYGDTARMTLPLNLLVMDPDSARVAWTYDAAPPEQNGDGEIIARPGPGPTGPYDWFWINGTRLELTGQRGSVYRVRLDRDLHPWVNVPDVVLEPKGTAPPRSRVEVVRLAPEDGWVDVHVGIHEPLPYRVEEGDGLIRLLVYGANSRVSFLQHGPVDPLIRRAEWDQPTDNVFRLTVFTTRTPWGYDVLRADNGDLVLRIRRPPALDPAHPLRGAKIVVDPGHGGADRFTVGPTGLTEADADLGIATHLAELLRRAGAHVVMTRSTDSTVALMERTVGAESLDADLLVSTHNNAFPDGVNPWQNNGTSVYYFQPWSADLAWDIHRRLLHALGLRDLGVGRANLALARPTWMPAVLSETMFMMMPRQEVALRDPAVLDRIARAHLEGIRAFLSARLREGP